jgi:predicted glycosyltransferase
VPGPTSLLICGPSLPAPERDRIINLSRHHSHVIVREFMGDLMSHLAAADAIVSMAGYNTVCEVLTLGKRAVVVPRMRPVQEQWIRAERMDRLGLVRAIHPDNLDPAFLARSVASEILSTDEPPPPRVDLNALERIAELVENLRHECSHEDGHPLATDAAHVSATKPLTAVEVG